MITNPPVPSGYELMAQHSVTPQLTAWALKILHDPAIYQMFSTTTTVVGERLILARVEWHPPDSRIHAQHRGVTLYESISVAPEAHAAGIDVSHYQPQIQWPQVAASGVSFAFIKATEGVALADRSFTAHWVQAKQAGILRSAYHFFRPQLDARVQAEHFMAQLPDRGELPPVLDVEVADGVTAARLIGGVNTWLDIVGRAGKPLIYTSPGFWNSLTGTSGISKKADLWVAHWGARQPAPVLGWSTWTFWQHTNQATVPGIPGAAGKDHDVFNGSLAQLRQYSAAYLGAPVRSETATFAAGAARS